MSNTVYINIENMLQLIKEEGDLIEVEAALSLNPSLTWVKFILTDDLPNGNKQRVPKEEFGNIIKSGVYMPIKVAKGGISPGHDQTEPIGVITNLVVEENKIKGIGALWGEERPEDVSYLKQLYEEAKSINISWEIGCKDLLAEDGGVSALKDAFLFAATIVGRPAYGGRTPITGMASREDEEDKELNELEELKSKLDIVEKERAQLLSEKDEAVSTLENKIQTLEAELEELRAFKTSIEAKEKAAEKFEEIKEKFTEAGLTMPDNYFEERKEKLLSMDVDSLDFFIKDLVLFKSEASIGGGIALPNLTRSSEAELTPAELAKKLREQKEN